MSELLAGYFGEPDEVQIPPRSFRRITRAVFDSDERNTGNREVSFRAVRDSSGTNVSEVCVQSRAIDGRQIDSEVRVVYRNGFFKGASVVSYGEEMSVSRLSEAIYHILSPRDT